jgi:hypothetical protein
MMVLHDNLLVTPDVWDFDWTVIIQNIAGNNHTLQNDLENILNADHHHHNIVAYHPYFLALIQYVNWRFRLGGPEPVAHQHPEEVVYQPPANLDVFYLVIPPPLPYIAADWPFLHNTAHNHVHHPTIPPPVAPLVVPALLNHQSCIQPMSLALIQHLDEELDNEERLHGIPHDNYCFGEQNMDGPKTDPEPCHVLLLVWLLYVLLHDH